MTGVGEDRTGPAAGSAASTRLPPTSTRWLRSVFVAPRRSPTSSASRRSRCASPTCWPPSRPTWRWAESGRVAAWPHRQGGSAGGLSRYELRNLIKELESGGAEESEAEGDDEGAAPVAAIETDYRCILDEAEFDEWLARLQVAPLFAFDTETTSLDYMEARVVGVSFAIEPGRRPTCPSVTIIWGRRYS